jgi:hypothetical protein
MNLYRVVPFVAVLVVVASCQGDQRSVTGVSRAAGPAATVTAASTTSLSPTADTYLNTNTVNYSTDVELHLYTWPDAQIANAVLMKFDLASIPAGSTISSATLNLYLTSSDPTPDPTYTVTVHTVVNKNPVLSAATGYKYDGVNFWTANNCCANGAYLAQSDIGPAVDTKGIDKTAGFKQWNVTSTVQGWFNSPSTNFGLLVNSDPSRLRDRWRYFGSAENLTIGQRPYLTVVFTPPASSPGTVTDLGVASVTNNSATLSFTEVHDGTGQPAKYYVRFAVAPISWGTATDVSQGTCQVPMAGTVIGARRTCTVLGLSPSTTYQFQLVAFRGTLNVDAVFGELSNVATGTTASGSGSGPWPNEPAGLLVRSDWGLDVRLPSSGDSLIPGSPGWYVVANAAPGSPRGWAQLAEDPSAPASPPGVYDFVYPQGMLEGNAPATVYYPGLGAFEVFAGFWWKPSSPFDPGPNGNKIAFIFNGGGGAGGQQFIILKGDGKLHVLPEYPGDFRWRDPNVNATVVTLGVWHRIEWYSNVTTGEMKYWLDGVLQGSYTDVRNTFRFDMFQFSPTWGGNSGAAKRETDHYWFDHVHLSTR